MRRLVLPGLFLAGLGLRLLGLLFNGTDDLDQIIFQWGAGVRELGLAAAFRDNYGVFSYALYGLAAALAEYFPRYWWAPYKLMEVLWEAGILLALGGLVSRRALLLYWLNPWFILHGAWQGFWDGPHTLLALLAVLSLRRVRRQALAWGLAGALLMASAMFKPQGLVYFVLPLGIYGGFLLLQRRGQPLLCFVAGLALVLGLATALLLAAGGEAMAIADNFLTATSVMPNLCNDCLNIWRPITGFLQAVLGQQGPTISLELPPAVYSLLHLLALGGALALVVWFAFRLAWTRGWRLPQPPPPRQLSASVRVIALPVLLLFALGLLRTSAAEQTWLLAGRYSPKYALLLGMLLLSGATAAFVPSPIGAAAGRALPPVTRALQALLAGRPREEWRPHHDVLLILALASLVIPQIGTRAHVNHAYAGLVLLIPLALARRRLLLPWAAMVAIQFYGQLALHLLGRNTVLPLWFTDYEPAQALLARVAEAAQGPDPLLAFQSTADHLLYYLPREPVLPALMVVQFIFFVLVVRQLWAWDDLSR